MTTKITTPIPVQVAQKFLPDGILELLRRGKVRDTYELWNFRLLLALVTDRISILDFILAAEVPQKGEILNALKVFWSLQIGNRFPQDLAAFGKDIDLFLPPELRGNSDLQKRATIVKNLDMIHYEAIVREYLAGSGARAYLDPKSNRIVCGHQLPPGLMDGDRLREPIFTPTTKAEVGHDEHVDVKMVRATTYGPAIEAASLFILKVTSEIALAKGIIEADGKFEFGIDPITHELVLGDEPPTPDSFRFWLMEDWKQSREEGRSPKSYDKEPMRNWGRTRGIDTLDPKNPKHVKFVHSLKVPDAEIDETRRRYRYIFYLLTGKRLETFQREDMGIDRAAARPQPVEIVIGSKSDLSQIERGLEELEKYDVPHRVHVVSCHRHPEDLRRFVRAMVMDNATVIAAAGKAAALPGVLQGWLRCYDKGHIPVIGVALQGETPSQDIAARLSIEELPRGIPIIRDEYGWAYSGPTGFLSACRRAIKEEFSISTTIPEPPHFNLRVFR